MPLSGNLRLEEVLSLGSITDVSAPGMGSEKGQQYSSMFFVADYCHKISFKLRYPLEKVPLLKTILYFKHASLPRDARFSCWSPPSEFLL